MTRSDTESLGDLGAARAVARRRPNPLNMGRGELPCRPIAPILRLSRSCRPTAIAGTIIIMDLYPIERHPGWAQPPVGEEALGSGFSIFAVAPAVANPDASGTIISKCFVAWVRAAPEHCCPRPIFSRWLGPAQAMLEPTRGDLPAAALTTTTLSMTAAQVMRTHNVHRGAIAEASPHHGAAIVVLNSRYSNQPPEAGASYIRQAHHMRPIPPARCAPASLSILPEPPPISGTVVSLCCRAWSTIA
jgi:hypothetical protein